MKDFGVFDIMGPVMIGPSSSHTAGAARLAKVAASIVNDEIKEVKFYLHGSFAKTYKGHGTDKALLAGIMNIDAWDDKLKESFKIAEENGLKYEFIEADLGDVHPNTVKFEIKTKNGNLTEVVGSSIGGGNIVIIEIDGQELQFNGNNYTIVARYNDVPGVIARITSLIYELGINIGTMRVIRETKISIAKMVFELDEKIDKSIIKRIEEIEDIHNVKIIEPIK